MELLVFVDIKSFIEFQFHTIASTYDERWNQILIIVSGSGLLESLLSTYLFKNIIIISNNICDIFRIHALILVLARIIIMRRFSQESTACVLNKKQNNSKNK